MAYVPVPSLREEPDIGERSMEFLDDVSSREEFLRYRVAVRRDLATNFRMHGEQKFVSEFQNPHTPFTRCLLNWWTGTGKTNTAVNASLEFLRHKDKTWLKPSIYVIGFTKDLFIDSMLIRPEFGFVTQAELGKLRMLRLALARGSIDVNHYTAYMGALRRRITDPSRGGMYQFYGFKEFANRLFRVTMRGLEEEFNIHTVYTASESLEEAKVRLDAAIAGGLVAINDELVENMRGSLMIVDEIHNTYNIREKNTYGIAIQYALNKLDVRDGELSVRALFLSATPMTGSATEIVDLLNLLVPQWYLTDGGYTTPLRRTDFFDERNNLLPGALGAIGRLSIGRVSFLYDTNKASYPERIIEGVEFPQIPYLRFTLCEMSPYHYEGYRDLLKTGKVSDKTGKVSDKTGKVSDKTGKVSGDFKIPLNAYSVYDIAFPSETGVTFKTEEIVAGLSRASEKWLTKTGVRIDWRQEGERIPVISGPFIKHIEKYSSKYAKMIQDVKKFISTRPGKILIYHDRVQLSGVLFLEEILKEFGVTEYGTEATDHTLCAVCGHVRKGHKPSVGGADANPHEFRPAQFVSLHYGIDHSTIRQNLEKFDSPANVDGYLCRVLLGARMIQEGHDFTAIRLQLVLSCPTDISTLIQLLGRSVRAGSHLMLPPEERNVRVKIYVTVPKMRTAARTGEAAGELAFELNRYEVKMREYVKIQKINRILWTYAVDAYVNEPKIGPSLGKEPTLEALPFKTPIRPTDTKYSTYFAYNYSKEEVETIKFVIWSLFRRQKIWSYADLLGAVRDSSFSLGVEEDSRRFGEENFALALRQAMHSKLDRKIVQIAGDENMFVVVPISEKGPVVDIEVYDRDQPDITPISVNINEYVENVRASTMFERQLRRVCARYESGEKPAEFSLVEEVDEFHYGLMRLIIADEPRVNATMKDAGYPNALKYIKSMYEDYKFLLTAAVVKESGIPAARTGGARRPYVGYFTRTDVLVYSGNEWLEYPRSMLAYGQRFDENDKLVGFIDKKDGRGKFKVRRPLDVVTKGVKDLRSVDRGIVCGSLPRDKQVNYLRMVSKLFRDPAKVLDGRGGESPSDVIGDSSTVCTRIFQALLSLEFKERKKVKGMENGVRFVYMFNDPMPLFTAT